MHDFPQSDRLYFPATERNRRPITDALSLILPRKGSVLEIASGSGEHIIAFQRSFPELIWQASDFNLDHCKSINAWICYANLFPQMPYALQLNVLDEEWVMPSSVQSQLMVILSINLIHIAPWSCCKSLVSHSAEYLPVGGRLIFYGPFRMLGQHVSDSNLIFDQSLRQRNSLWGVRDLESVKKLCLNVGLVEMKVINLPSNNFFVSFIKR